MLSFKQYLNESEDPCWDGYKRKPGTKKYDDGSCIPEESVDEATYQGKDVPLNKPMAGDVKKSKVYVDPDGDGVAKKVNFGDKNMTIKKNIPAPVNHSVLVTTVMIQVQRIKRATGHVKPGNIIRKKTND